MPDTEYTGMEFMQGFFMFAALLWVVGAIVIIGTVAIGDSRIASAQPGAPAAPVAEMPATQ